jgi:hypothetical protein
MISRSANPFCDAQSPGAPSPDVQSPGAQSPNAQSPGAIVRIAQAGAEHLGKLGTLFGTALQRLYAAHVEKAQMRLAPTPIPSGRLGERGHFTPPFVGL